MSHLPNYGSAFSTGPSFSNPTGGNTWGSSNNGFMTGTKSAPLASPFFAYSSGVPPTPLQNPQGGGAPSPSPFSYSGPSTTPAGGPPAAALAIFGTNLIAGGGGISGAPSFPSVSSSNQTPASQSLTTYMPASNTPPVPPTTAFGPGARKPYPFGGYTATINTSPAGQSPGTGPFGISATPSTPAAGNMFNAALNAYNSAVAPTTGAPSPFKAVSNPFAPVSNQASSVTAAPTAPTSVFTNIASTAPVSAFAAAPTSIFANVAPSVPAPATLAMISNFGSNRGPATPAAKNPTVSAPSSARLPAGSLTTIAPVTSGSIFRNSTPPRSLFTPAPPPSSTPVANTVPTAPVSFFASRATVPTPIFGPIAPSQTSTSKSTAPTPMSFFTSGASTQTPTLASSMPSAPTSAPAAQTQAAPSAPVNNAQASSTNPSKPTALPFKMNRPQESRLKIKSLEEITDQWASDVEKYKKEFHDRGSEIKQWDATLVQNGNKIVKLTTEVKNAERTQSIVDNALEQLENEQENMEKLFDYYEALLAEMEKQSVGEQSTDTEREQIFDAVVMLSAKLASMETGAGDLVSALNKASAKIENISTDDHLSSIVKILNEHLQVMQWVDTQTATLSEKLFTVRTKSRNSHTADTEGDEAMRSFSNLHGMRY